MQFFWFSYNWTKYSDQISIYGENVGRIEAYYCYLRY